MLNLKRTPKKATPPARFMYKPNIDPDTRKKYGPKSSKKSAPVIPLNQMGEFFEEFCSE